MYLYKEDVEVNAEPEVIKIKYYLLTSCISPLLNDLIGRQQWNFFLGCSGIALHIQNVHIYLNFGVCNQHTTHGLFLYM